MTSQKYKFTPVITITNNSGLRIPRSNINSTARNICRRLGLNKRLIINFIFLNNAQITRMKYKYHRKKRSTDVITFSYNYNNVGVPCLEGDVFISIEQVNKQSSLFGNTALKELQYVMIHGILHVLGYRDYTRLERSKMFKKQDALFLTVS